MNRPELHRPERRELAVGTFPKAAEKGRKETKNYQFCQGIMLFTRIWGYETRRLESVVGRHVEEGAVEQAVVQCVELGKGTGTVPVVMQSKAPLQEDARMKGKPGR